MFRRYRESVYWHWCDACTYWPLSDYQVFSVQPPGGQLCPECLERSNSSNQPGESECRDDEPSHRANES